MLFRSCVILTSIVLSQEEDSLPTETAGSHPVKGFLSPSGCCQRCSRESSLTSLRNASNRRLLNSPTLSVISNQSKTLSHSGASSIVKSESSIASRPSMAPGGSFSTSADIPTASPSPTTGSFPTGKGRSLFYGETMQTRTAKKP